MSSARLLAASVVAIFPAFGPPPKPAVTHVDAPPTGRSEPAPADYSAPVPMDGGGVRVCIKTKGDRCRYSYDFASRKYVQRCWGAVHCVAYKVDYKPLYRHPAHAAFEGEG